MQPARPGPFWTRTWPPTGASFTSLLSRTGVVGTMLCQALSPDPTCKENEACESHDDQPLSDWYIWCLMLLLLIIFICCSVLICLRCWLKRSHLCSPGRTVAVFSVNDVDFISGREAVTGPAARVDLHSPHPELYPVSHPVPLGPPPSYEDSQKTSRL
ncbi:transmembrane protein 207 [Sarcophilus harrisii]|uniref:Transmembrane protein 207 n=1 Tax=Sarcophilus harrisii TaxID=9305 RepID=A0A7N4NHH8_SARHA|nr:transmembrane protein 207 [Sarcophilus harrisii]